MVLTINSKKGLMIYTMKQKEKAKKMYIVLKPLNCSFSLLG